MINQKFVRRAFNEDSKIPHYFDGRVMTASMLQEERDAVLKREAFLGQANGDGVIDGLVVGPLPTDPTQIQITAGIGLNRKGQVLHLSSPCNFLPFPPASETSPQPTLSAGMFTSRAALEAVKANAATDGIYLLTATPTSKLEGSIPSKNANASITSGIRYVSDSGSRWEVEGLEFNILRLSDSQLTELSNDLGGIQVTSKNLRNLVAHWNYGTLNIEHFGQDPFHWRYNTNSLDSLLGLTGSDLPLAIFHWNGSALTFVDNWSVRRRITAPDALAGTRFPLSTKVWVSEKHVAENQARFLQFQDHLESLIEQSIIPQIGLQLTKVKAIDYFAFLPPVGFLPITQDSLSRLICDGAYGNANFAARAESAIQVKSIPQAQQQATSRPNTSSPPQIQGQLDNVAQDITTIGTVGEAIGTVGSVALNFLPGGGIVNIARAIINPLVWLKFLHIGGPSKTQETNNSLQLLAGQIDELRQMIQNPGATPTKLTTTQQASASITPTTPATPSAAQQFATSASTPLNLEVTPSIPQPPPHISPAPVFNQHQTSDAVLRAEICQTLSATNGRSAAGCFDLGQFFDGIPIRISLIGNDTVHEILHQSWYQDAIDLGATPNNVQGSGDSPGLPVLPLVIDIYIVEENLRNPQAPLYIQFHKRTHPIELVDLRGVLNYALTQ